MELLSSVYTRGVVVLVCIIVMAVAVILVALRCYSLSKQMGEMANYMVGQERRLRHVEAYLQKVSQSMHAQQQRKKAAPARASSARPAASAQKQQRAQQVKQPARQVQGAKMANVSLAGTNEASKPAAARPSQNSQARRHPSASIRIPITEAASVRKSAASRGKHAR
jgi:hypothetical protein